MTFRNPTPEDRIARATRVARQRDAKRASGECRHCTQHVQVDHVTGKVYDLCPDHLDMDAARKAAKKAKR